MFSSINLDTGSDVGKPLYETFTKEVHKVGRWEIGR